MLLVSLLIFLHGISNTFFVYFSVDVGRLFGRLSSIYHRHQSFFLGLQRTQVSFSGGHFLNGTSNVITSTFGVKANLRGTSSHTGVTYSQLLRNGRLRDLVFGLGFTTISLLVVISSFVYRFLIVFSRQFNQAVSLLTSISTRFRGAGFRFSRLVVGCFVRRGFPLCPGQPFG